MTERIDLAHTVALGSIDDEDHAAVRELMDTTDESGRADFLAEVRRTHETLAQLAETTATPPPPGLRAKLLAAIETDAPEHS